MSERRADHSSGWCSLRLRFSERELVLLRAAEEVHGAALAHQARPEVLRKALALAKAARKLARAAPETSVSLEEGELRLLLEALRHTTEEVRGVSDQSHPVEAAQAGPGARAGARTAAERRDQVLSAFPELVERGLWRSFGVCRELEALAERIEQALKELRTG